MPYVVEVTFLDFTGLFANISPAMMGGIFVPPPPGGGPAGAPTFAGTGSSPGQPFTVTFHALGAPPEGFAAMLVTETTFGGDLFRSGPVQLPPSPAQLTVNLVPPQQPSPAPPTLTPSQVSGLVGSVAGNTLSAGGGMTVAIATATAKLVAGAVKLTLTGTIRWSWFIFSASTGFTLTMFLGLAPSHDPSDTSDVVSAPVVTTGAAAPPALTLTSILLSPLAPALAGLFASEVASVVAAEINQMIPSIASGALANMNRQLTPTAVISLERAVITGSGIGLIASVSDLFGPGIEPIPISLRAVISPPPRYGEPIDYTVEVVEDTATGQAVPGATVKITTPAPTETKPQNIDTVTETTGSNGLATFPQLTLQSVELPVFNGKGMSGQLTIYPWLSAKAAGFIGFSEQLNEPPP
jgi:hypothetical protein